MCCFLLVLLGFVLNRLKDASREECVVFPNPQGNVTKKCQKEGHRRHFTQSLLLYHAPSNLFLYIRWNSLYFLSLPHKRCVRIPAEGVKVAFKWLFITITKPRWRLRSEKGQTYRSCRSLRIFDFGLSSASPPEPPVNVSTAMLQQASRVTSLLTAYLVFILSQALMWVE